MFLRECLMMNHYVCFERTKIIILAVRNCSSWQIYRSFSDQTKKKAIIVGRYNFKPEAFSNELVSESNRIWNFQVKLDFKEMLDSVRYHHILSLVYSLVLEPVVIGRGSLTLWMYVWGLGLLCWLLKTLMQSAVSHDRQNNYISY